MGLQDRMVKQNVQPLTINVTSQRTTTQLQHQQQLSSAKLKSQTSSTQSFSMLPTSRTYSNSNSSSQNKPSTVNKQAKRFFDLSNGGLALPRLCYISPKIFNSEQSQSPLSLSSRMLSPTSKLQSALQTPKEQSAEGNYLHNQFEQFETPLSNVRRINTQIDFFRDELDSSQMDSLAGSSEQRIGDLSFSSRREVPANQKNKKPKKAVMFSKTRRKGESIAAGKGQAQSEEIVEKERFVQPSFMQERGSMCITELWPKSMKVELVNCHLASSRKVKEYRKRFELEQQQQQQKLAAMNHTSSPLASQFLLRTSSFPTLDQQSSRINSARSINMKNRNNADKPPVIHVTKALSRQSSIDNLIGNSPTLTRTQGYHLINPVITPQTGASGVPAGVPAITTATTGQMMMQTQNSFGLSKSSFFSRKLIEDQQQQQQQHPSSQQGSGFKRDNYGGAYGDQNSNDDDDDDDENNNNSNRNQQNDELENPLKEIVKKRSELLKQMAQKSKTIATIDAAYSKSNPIFKGITRILYENRKDVNESPRSGGRKGIQRMLQTNATMSRINKLQSDCESVLESNCVLEESINKNIANVDQRLKKILQKLAMPAHTHESFTSNKRYYL